MKSVKKITRVMALILSVVMSVSMLGLGVSAASYTDEQLQKIYDAYSAEHSFEASDLTSDMKDKAVAEFEGGTLDVSGVTKAADTSDIDKALEGYKAPKANTENVQQILNTMDGIIGTLLGILCYVIVIGLPLITAIDVCYITIPAVRDKADTAKSNGNAMMTKTDKNGNVMLRFISDEAQHAIESADLESGKTPLKTYFKSRIGAYIAVAVILYMLIGGQITVITKIAVKAISGLMGLLSQLGE